ncbi:MAG: porin family protein [Saprospiraceae bacterium]
MKNYLSLVIALLTLLGSAQSQHINIGIKGGLNIYTVNGNNYSKKSQKIAYNLGLLGHIHLKKDLALQPEIVYSVQGIKYENNGNKVDLQLNYVNIPVLLQYMFDNGFRLELGPQLGVLVNAKNKVGSSNADVSSNFKNIDFGVAVGMSYVKPSTGFGIDVRYNYGFANINTSNSINAYNRGVQVGLFYLFQHRS